MTFDEDSMWMDNLEEFVFEERRAVTYKWLSRLGADMLVLTSDHV
jgi:hypothetical protein